jgi:hypothetical protein
MLKSKVKIRHSSDRTKDPAVFWCQLDKETFWIACEMAQEPYYVNPDPAYEMRDGQSIDPSIHQFLEGHLFYKQKSPISVSRQAYFLPAGIGKTYPIEEEAWDMMNKAALIKSR